VRVDKAWGTIVNLEGRQHSGPRPRTSKQSRGTRMRSVLRFMRRHGWLRPRRIGCLLVVLAITTTWLVSQAVEGVNALFRPPVVAGNPLGTAAPAPPIHRGSPTVDRITQRGQLIVAIRDVPGLAQRSASSEHYSGFDIALAQLIAHDLGVDPDRTSFKPLPAGVREASLNRGEVDLVLGGYEVNATPSANVAVAGPYLVRALQLAVPVTSRATDLNSLGHEQVCAPDGSLAAATLATRGVAVQTRATLADCAALLGGPVGAIAGDQTAIAAVLSQAPGTLRVLDEPVGITEYGIGLPPGDPVLHDRITAVLRHAIEDGTWARLYAEYLGSPVPGAPVPR